jgi:hypothetical protein
VAAFAAFIGLFSKRKDVMFTELIVWFEALAEADPAAAQAVAVVYGLIAIGLLGLFVLAVRKYLRDRALDRAARALAVGRTADDVIRRAAAERAERDRALAAQLKAEDPAPVVSAAVVSPERAAVVRYILKR